ncbi:MAG: helix-turn-helix domain-containing protein [Nanoarchaeota archaeon]
MVEEMLQKLGLSPVEIKVYLYLLKETTSYAGKISAETLLNRTNVYEALQRLLQKGLVASAQRNKVKWFEAQPPERLLALVAVQDQVLKETTRQIISAIPLLKKTIKDGENELSVVTFIGKKGLRMLFEELLAEKQNVFLIAAELQFKKVLGPYFDLWHKKRAEQKTRQYSIFPLHMKNQLKKKALLNYRFVESRFTNPATTIICGNKCAFIHWEENPIAIRISNLGVVRSQKNHFDLIWKNAKE